MYVWIYVMNKYLEIHIHYNYISKLRNNWNEIYKSKKHIK